MLPHHFFPSFLSYTDTLTQRRYCAYQTAASSYLAEDTKLWLCAKETITGDAVI